MIIVLIAPVAAADTGGNIDAAANEVVDWTRCCCYYVSCGFSTFSAIAWLILGPALDRELILVQHF